ncbi:MAG TPA: DUF167 domain-containing protein [Miltoncostaeaceae bacterium]|nr:DUF167 domain-containing protein [Miltoncostaeaceae bacterium]
MPEPPPWLSLTADGVVVEVKAVPRSRRTLAVGLQDGMLRVQIAAAPHRGQSNAALCAYLAERAGVRPSAAAIRRGSGGARKLVEIRGDPGALAATLARRIGDDLATVTAG